MVVFFVIVLFLVLVLYVGVSNYSMGDIGGDFVFECLKGVDLLLVFVLICLCIFVMMLEYIFCNLVYLVFDGCVYCMLIIFNMMVVSFVCNVVIEYFIIQMMGSSVIFYWFKNVGICMVIYLCDVVSDL